MLTLAFSSKSHCAQVQCVPAQPRTATVWLLRSEQWVLTGIRPTTLRFQSTCVFPVSVSTSFPTRCSAKLPGVSGGLRTLCLLYCIQQCVVYVSKLNHLRHRFFFRGANKLVYVDYLYNVESFSTSKLVITVLEVGCVSSSRRTYQSASCFGWIVPVLAVSQTSAAQRLASSGRSSPEPIYLNQFSKQLAAQEEQTGSGSIRERKKSFSCIHTCFLSCWENQTMTHLASLSLPATHRWLNPHRHTNTVPVRECTRPLRWCTESASPNKLTSFKNITYILFLGWPRDLFGG